MITEKELMEAIKECETEPATLAKISKLADFYTVYEHLFGMPMENGYSYALNAEKVLQTNGGTEFLQAVDGKNSEKVMAIIDELLEAVKLLQPRMYDGVLRRLYEI